MKSRKAWISRIETAWQERSVLWLQGVRRVGKTTLCRQLPDLEYFDCELPRDRRMLEDPESFLADHAGRRIALDEIHRLGNPSEILKIAADHHPDVKVIATGSSTLAATAKFRDTLSGRKREIWLTPMTIADSEAFGKKSLRHRLLHGGLPGFFLAPMVPERDFQEWLDAFWSKDIQELFRLEKRAAFQRFFEMLLIDSGGIFEATRFARACEISRPSIVNYLGVLEATFVAHVVRPFSGKGKSEIIAAPKVYGFDTAFIAYYRGWHDLRASDLGALFEHFVLNELHAKLQARSVNYWRDKQGHEVDFVIARRGKPPIAIECKWSADGFDPRNLVVFRRRYDQGANYVVAQDVDRAFSREMEGVRVEFVGIDGLIERVSPAP